MQKERPQISGPDVRHMRKVLRHAPGDRVVLIDGSGYEYPAVIESLSLDTATFSVTGKIPSRATSPLELVIAQGFLKEKKMDTIIRHLTELGISRWVPVFSERSVARPDKKRLAERERRWETISIESLKQCGLSRLPEISQPIPMKDLLEDPEPCDGKVVFWEDETQPAKPVDALFPAAPRKILVLIGPEGGFSSEEIEMAKAAGFQSASMGPRILRAETAAIAACTLIQYIYGDMKKSP